MFKSIRKGVLAGVLLLGLSTATFASAADLRFNSGRTSNFEVSASDMVSNLYAASGQVVINANPTKDLVVAGGTVQVSGNVGRNLIAAGGNIDITGNVGASARIAGGNIHIDSKTIAEDLVVAGGTVYVNRDTVINGDLMVAGGNVIVDGTVNGNIKFTGGSLVLNGKVGGNADVKASQYFQLGGSANILGAIRYSSSREYIRDPNAKVAGQVIYSQMARRNVAKGAFGLLTLAFLIKLLSTLIVCYLLLWFFKNKFKLAVERIGHGFWKNVGVGLVGLIVVPILCLLLLFTVIGWYAAVIIGLLYALTLMLSGVFSVAYFGSWAVAKFQKQQMRIDYVTIAIGVILLGVIQLIPVLGWIFAIILVMAGMGMLLRSYKRLAE